MPTYEYRCVDCGDFTASQPIAQYQQPQPCPDCGADSPRALLTAPAFAGMSSGTRHAHATNERSSHAPECSSDQKPRHSAGCGCCGAGQKSNAVKAADGSKTFPTKRPWMISH